MKPITLNKASLADIKVEWTTTPSIKISDIVLDAWRDVGSAKDASIELYLIDNSDDLKDWRLIG